MIGSDAFAFPERAFYVPDSVVLPSLAMRLSGSLIPPVAPEKPEGQEREEPEVDEIEDILRDVEKDSGIDKIE